MRLEDFKESFKTDYTFEVKKRGVNLIQVANRTLAKWISEAEREIQNRLKITSTYQDITTELGVNVYELPTDFGERIKVESQGYELEEVGITEIISTGGDTTPQGRPQRYAIYSDAGRCYMSINQPNEEYLIRVWYYHDYPIYSPDGNTIQEWGVFDGKEFSGNLRLPDKCEKALRYHIMSNIFPDMFEKYEYEVKLLRDTRVGTTNKKEYSMGGYPQDIYRRK